MNKSSSLLLHLYLHLLHFLIMNKSSNLKKNKNKKTKKVKILNKKKKKKEKKNSKFFKKKKSSIKIFNSFKHSRFPNHPQNSSKHGVCPKLGAFARYAEFFSTNNYVTN